jgi:hypothetical protein
MHFVSLRMSPRMSPRMSFRARLNLAALAVLVTGGAWLAMPAAARAAATQRCITTVIQPDGTEVTIVVTGDRCVFNTSTWTCTCS